MIIRQNPQNRNDNGNGTMMKWKWGTPWLMVRCWSYTTERCDARPGKGRRQKGNAWSMCATFLVVAFSEPRVTSSSGRASTSHNEQSCPRFWFNRYTVPICFVYLCVYCFVLFCIAMFYCGSCICFCFCSAFVSDCCLFLLWCAYLGFVLSRFGFCL